MADGAVLSQREIDALLNADAQELSESAAPSAAAAAVRQPAKDSGRRIKPYDFRHPEKLSKEQLRGLQLIQQAVAGVIATSFSTRLRAPAEARLSALERGIYEEYIAQVGTSAAVVTIDMSPLQGYAVASFGLDFAFGIIDRLMGGRGTKGPRATQREPTDIDMALIRHIGLDIASSLVEPWARITELQPDVTDLGVGGQVLHVVPAGEFVITAWYEVRLAGETGGISISFPLTILEQVLPKLAGSTLFEHRLAGPADEDSKVREEQLLPLVVDARAILGGARVPATDMANLAPGDVIVLDRTADDPARLSLGSREFFVASPGTRGRHLALQITGHVDGDGRPRDFEEQSG